MGGIQVHRSQARRYTVMAQAGAGALLAGAFAAYAFLPVADQAKPPPVQETDGVKDGHGSTEPPIDFQSTADLLKIWDVASTEPDPGQKPVDEATPSTPTGTELRYLGAIVEPNRLVAIVSADGAQHLLAPGATYKGPDKRNVKVLEVRADAIVVAEGSDKRTIQLTKREGVVSGTASVGTAGGEDLGRGDGTEFEANGDMEGIDPRAMDRRGPAGRRPTPPGTKNVPRPPRSAPSSNPKPRQGAPEGT